MKEYLLFTLAVVVFFAETGRPPRNTAGDRSYEEAEFSSHTNSWDSAPPVTALEGDAPPSQDDPVMLELSGLGKYGDTIARARGQVARGPTPGQRL